MSAEEISQQTEQTKPRIEEKNVRHTFTPAELVALGKDLSRAITNSRLLEDELKQVKASYTAKQTEAEGRVQTISAEIDAGFTHRKKPCRVVYRPRDKKKDYWPVDQPDAEEPALTEDMTQADFQADLLQAESLFELREEIELFPPAGNDRGVIVVGRLGSRWFSALRIQIGAVRIEERLDSEQRSTKTRPEAVKRASTNALDWLTGAFGKDRAKAFGEHLKKVVEAHKDREE